MLALSREVEGLKALAGGLRSELQGQLSRFTSRIEEDESYLTRLREAEAREREGGGGSA